MAPDWKDKFRTWLGTAKEVLYGLTVHELARELGKDRNQLNNMFLLMIFGDMAGLPFFPPYYSLRLLPYIIPSLETWKRSILREKDITDIIAVDI